jgi:DNA repair exonuclease SbcCD ATPase subunit
MIRRLHVEGWRAFEHLSLELDEGVTFVVAENGIGKTSLIEAASWGLYGELSGVDPGAALRFGEGRVLVEVDLELPEGKILAIERSLTGHVYALRAWHDGELVEQAELAGVIANAFGASQDFLSRTTLLASAAVADDSSGVFELHKHLCQVFGVDALQRAAAQLRRAHVAAEKEATKQRQETRRAAADIGQLRSQLADIEQESSIAEQARSESRDAVDAAQHHLDQIRAARAAHLQADANRAQFEELRSAAQALPASMFPTGPLSCADPVTGAAELRRLLDDAETNAIRIADEVRAELAGVGAQLSVAQTGIAELHDAGAECPVCRRGLAPHDRSAAEQRHRQDIADLTNRQARLQADWDAATDRVQDIRALARRAARLQDPMLMAETIAESDIDKAMQNLENARTVHEERVSQAAEIRAERTNLQRRIDDEETATVKEKQVYLVHRREAAANIAAQVIEATANSILTERIGPLVTEITHRWKRVFVNRGELRLRHDGRLVLVRGTHEIGFDQLSSGEKVIALLATRLLVLSTSTRASFLWLDEPLEHLDPKNRRLAASLMATAGEHTRQLLVTTYEERLARRLESTGSVAVRYIKASG